MQDLCSLRSLITDLQQAEEEFSRTIGLTMCQASMICAIDHGYDDLRQLQAQLSLTPSRVTRLVDSLEHKGLVVRHRPDQDRRAVSVKLTEEGKQLIRQSGDYHLRLPKDIEDLLMERSKEKSWTEHT